jgi:hypothetical protein
MAAVIETEGLTKQIGDRDLTVLPFVLAAACGCVSWVALERHDLETA